MAAQISAKVAHFRILLAFFYKTKWRPGDTAKFSHIRIIRIILVS
jgi:hypothetical protein